MTEAPAEAASRRPSPPRLAFRLALVLSLGAGAILLAAGAWNLASQRRQLTRLVEGQATTVIEMIRGATRDSMLRNDSAELSRLVTGLASRDEVDRIRVFDKQGRINYSSEPVEIGAAGRPRRRAVRRLPRRRQAARRAPTASGRTRIFERPGEGPLPGAGRADQERAGLFDRRLPRPLAERRPCSACSTSSCRCAASTPRSRDSQRQLATGLVGTVAAVVGARLPARLGARAPPGGRAHRRRAAARRRRLHARACPRRCTDEIGDLERAWNRMAGELGDAHAELAAWSRKLEERVAEKTRELEATHHHLLRAETMTSLGKLAASVAHELNNPLAGIATYARLLRRRRDGGRGGGHRRSRPATDNERILKLMEDEALRCGNIVRNLLLFSRTPGARFAPSDLAPIAERCAMLVRHQAELAGVALAVEMPPACRRSSATPRRSSRRCSR